ncbi:MAG: hypothetical protein LUE86_00510, partial [Clostridiales bacterium]|nr:hypothetical protein [Clostridiales bacterium]
DAKYIDRRDGSRKKGSQLPNGRTNRNHKKDTENLRIFRKQRISKGRTVLLVKRHDYQQGDVVLYKGKRYVSEGMKNGGKALKLKRGSKIVNPSVNSVKRLYRGNGWKEVLAD